MSSKNLDPKEYGLSSRTRLVQERSGEISILIDRKSRIVMKDGHRILEQVQKLRSVHAEAIISVLTSAPVCSKTRTFLNDRSISIRDLGV